MAERLHIARLGAAGDGIAEHAGAPLFVPYALPGEIVLAEPGPRRAELISVEAPSPERIAPFCPYYGECGGCVAQHIGPPLYADWKRGMVAEALSRARLEVPLDPLRDAHGAGRRRLTFHARLIEGTVEVGFMAPKSHRLVPIALCPIGEPVLAGAADAARAVASLLRNASKPLDLLVTVTEGGLDIDLRGHGPLGHRQRQLLIGEAARLDLARLSLHGEVLVELRPPLVAIGNARVLPPPGSFLQASAEGERILSELVAEACSGSKRIADLFAGCGPFSLKLAETAEIHAVEAEAAALAALDRAFRNATGLRRISTEARDLFRRPLLSTELARFDAVVLDPPRAGAEAQSRQLALSGPARVVMVSCDPGTFARDAAILVAGGYVLERVTPVDQFKYTAHVELVGAFRRPDTARKKGGRR